MALSGPQSRRVHAWQRATRHLAEYRRDVADSRIALAQALWDAGRDRPRALALAADARDAFARDGAASASRLAEVAKWLGAPYRKMGTMSKNR